MELLSVEYGDFTDLFNGDDPEDEHSAYLKMILSIGPDLIGDPQQVTVRIVEALALLFPSVARAPRGRAASFGAVDTIAQVTGGFILDLQRDLCAWPSGSHYQCRPLQSGQEYELYVESVDERVGRFSAQLAVEVMRMLLLDEPFDPRLVWVIDLVRHLYRQPRLRLTPRRVVGVLGCSRDSAAWAIQELERYGYLGATDVQRQRRPTGRRILIVDDSAQIRDLLSRILELLGYDVITAVDGEEGLILLSWADYAAIFVDLVMPCLDGTTFLQRAREEGFTRPIFVISSYNYRWSTEEIRKQGATGYVRKPFSTAEIEALLKRHVK
jgi:CheY-like chemotaxis protein